MYLSRVELNVGLRETMKALQSPSKFHGAVESSFDGDRERRLWRLDELNGKKYIIILSQTVPNLKHFSEQYGFPNGYETKDYTPLLDRIENGGKWRFRLTANPTTAIHQENGSKRGKNVPHITSDYQKKWLSDRAEKCGFLLEENNFQTVERKWYRFRKKSGENSQYVQLLSVTFEGILTVTDSEKFKDTLCGGIGREKAYGQGLLTVIRV